ncbi:hypothetical protein D1AOALGA4SA_1335 [Olavius algarvensis Delta 1 endosymbiont]|nr:hypothetical protein D1AOALGA4SA_1335 [Olavius algarvensis Delta 1 endosymbiont]
MGIGYLVLVSIFQNHNMFAQDLCYCRIEYFWNAIDLNLKDRAKRYNKSSIFNLQSSIPACPGRVELILISALLQT